MYSVLCTVVWCGVVLGVCFGLFSSSGVIGKLLIFVPTKFPGGTFLDVAACLMDV